MFKAPLQCALTFFFAAFSMNPASAECASAALPGSTSNVLERLDAMATCIAELKVESTALKNAVLVSPAPCSSLGKSWKRYEPADGRFVLGVGGEYAPNSTGGEEVVRLTVDHMPSHSHDLRQFHSVNDGNMTETNASGKVPKVRTGLSDRGRWTTPWMAKQIHNSGGSLAHNNMPPFIAIYFCKMD